MGANLMRGLLRLAAFWLGLCALAAAWPAAAQVDQALLGPKQYVRTQGVPNVYTDSFTVPSTVSTPFVLRIANGAAGGANRISSGWVKVNGVQVVGPADFGMNVASIERPLNLSPSNTLEVQLASVPGGYITLTVIGRQVPPVPTSLAPNPLTITAGVSGALTATLTPVPPSAGALSVSSANPAVASVPASVPFAAGQASVQIPVSGLEAGSATVTASANGGSVSATVHVTPAPPTIASLSPASLSVTQGSSGTLTLTISAAQGADTQVPLSSSLSGVASVPAAVTVPAGQVSASIPVAGLSPGTAQITASLSGSSASSQVSVSAAPPTPVSLVPVLSSVALGGGTTLKLTISSAQASDTAVAIAAGPAGIIAVPAEVSVPAGQLTVSVPVSSVALGQAGITATLNGSSASAGINVVPPPARVVALEPAQLSLVPGAASLFTVRISAAQSSNVEVLLETDAPGVIQAPASVTVAQGATSAVFSVTGVAPGSAVLSASANDTRTSASVSVLAQTAAISSFLPSALPLQPGATGALTVTLNAVQDSATTVTLANSSPAVAEVPASITIPPGALSATVSAYAMSVGTTQVTASVNGSSASAVVEVAAPAPVVASLVPSSASLPKGTPVLLKATVSRAPNIATAVAVVSSDLAAASAPSQVVIAAGALSAEFPVMANAQGAATITASLNGGSASAAITIGPAELVNLTLSPQAPTNYVGESVPFTATGTMTDGTVEDFTARATWASSNEAIATIASTGVASPLAEGQTTIAASFTFTAVQTGQPVTVSSSTVLTAKLPTPLALSAPLTSLEVGQGTTVTVATSDPAPFGGLVVSLSGGGTGTVSFPATVTIPEYETSASFQLTATGAGSYTLTATAQNRLPATLAFDFRPQFGITGFTPAMGPIGTAVAIAGAGFDPNLSGNTVRFNGEPAVIVSGNAALLNAIVPPRATTGPITVTNVRGTATSGTPFTVQEREAFDITLSPAAIQVPLGGQGATRIRLSSTGLNPYPYGANLTISGLPAGVTATLERPLVALNLDSVLTLSAITATPSGSHSITVTASGASGVRTQTVTKTFTLEVLAAGATTVTGRVLHADDAAPFVGARIRLGGTHVFTDETGTYRFVSPPVLGSQVVLIDGNTNNTPQFEFPSGIAMPVTIVAGQDNKVNTSYIGRIDATKFSTIVPGQAATVTNPEIPGFALNIPQGATLIGWDGQPVTKISVRAVPVDRLPIQPLPSDIGMKTVYLYYFFREGGADPTTPIPVTYPNDLGALPGEQIEMWYYDESREPDPNSHQWKSMGFGTVSADGKSIVSNPGVGIPKFCCGAGGAGPRPPPPGNGGNGGGGDDPLPCPAPPKTQNPVDLASGNALVFHPRPFGTMSVLMPVNLNCKYRSQDTRVGLFGRGMTFTYDWFAQQIGEAVRVTNPDGVQFMLSRSPDGVFRATSGHQGAIQMEVTPTATGRILKLANGVRYEFDNPGRLTAMVDVSGNRTSFTLNAQGAPQTMTDAAGKVYQFQVSGNPPLVSRITDPAGRYVEFAYDASRRLSSYRDQGGGITLLEYDSGNRIRKLTDPRGAIKEIEYDSAGRAVRELLPESAEEQFAYNAVGNTVVETRHTDANGNATRYRFSNLGYTTDKIDALGRVRRNVLDPVTNLLRRSIDPAGRVTQLSYNQRGDLVRIIDPDNVETLVDYDLRFRKPVRIENALGHVTTMEYNALGKLSRITNAENETMALTYTPKGQVETIVDPLNRVSRFVYDSSGNLVESTNTASETVTRGYDLANRLVEVTDNLNRTTRFTYDDLDRITEVRDAALGLTKYAFDANDNVVSAQDQNGNPVESSAFDLRNRLVRRTDAKGLSTVYAYDGVGNVKRVTDRRGQITDYAYDSLNRIVQVSDADGRTTEYVYDLAGNLARISDSQSGELLMSYDARNRLTEVIGSQGSVGYTYDAIGRRLTRTISGGDVTSYTYDKVGRLTSVSLRGKSATYSYDVMGRLTERTLPNGLKATYQYDAADRVTSIAYVRPDNSLVDSMVYSYDAGGQRVQKAQAQTSLQETPFVATYDEANRLSTIDIAGETFSLSYDQNGNLLSKTGPVSGTTNYGWNARNQLVSLAGPSGSASFRYDATGRRIEKSINGVTTGFLYDGPQAIAEIQGGAVGVVYHTGVELDEVLARYAASGNKTLLADAIMSVFAQANDDQSVSNFYAYSPYGQSVALGADGGNSLQYTGRENDNLGLYYYRSRYYDPILKRFISEDPLGVQTGVNFYSYVGGIPTTYIDPYGEDWRAWVRAIGVAIGLSGTPGVGPDAPPAGPMDPKPVVQPGQVPGNPPVDPAKNPQKIPELPKPSPSFPKPPTPTPTPTPGVPGWFRPPVPILLCPACDFLLPRDDFSCPIA